MSTITKQAVQAVADLKAGYTLGHADVAILNELARIALASLEAEAVGEVVLGEFDDCGCHPDARVECIAADGQAGWENFKDGTRLYTAPTVPVSVPDAMEMDDDFDSAFEHGKAVGWNAYRAAMLQGANGTLTNEGTIPVTQFKPVADLYGLTSPTGGETSFTFDAVEARDFIDGGWSCQEYVELERFQEAVSGNSPVIPDGFCIMPKKLTAENGGKGALSGEFHVTNRIVCQSCGGEGCEDCNDEGGWDAEIPVSWDTIKRIHEAAVEACSLPAAPQQEVK